EAAADRAVLVDVGAHALLEGGDAQVRRLTRRAQAADADHQDGVDPGRRVVDHDHDRRVAVTGVRLPVGRLDLQLQLAARPRQGGLDDAAAGEAVRVGLRLAVVDRVADEDLLGARRSALVAGVRGLVLRAERVVGVRLDRTGVAHVALWVRGGLLAGGEVDVVLAVEVELALEELDQHRASGQRRLAARRWARRRDAALAGDEDLELGAA